MYKKKFLSLLFICLLSTTASAQVLLGPQEDIDVILANVEAFSQAYMSLDYDAIAGAYTEDGKIFPGGTDIISGREDIRAHWVLPEGAKVMLHEIHPEEIKVVGEYAYDYGYYNGISADPSANESAWSGKYVIVWQKVDGEWKMYLDMWNRRASQE